MNGQKETILNPIKNGVAHIWKKQKAPTRLSMSDRVLVIIVTFNAMQWIEKCIQSVKASSFPLDLFVVDNNSSDNTVAYIKEKHSSIKLIESRSNLGFGAANNIGLQYAIDNDYNYVYLLNQDAWIKPTQ